MSDNLDGLRKRQAELLARIDDKTASVFDVVEAAGINACLRGHRPRMAGAPTPRTTYDQAANALYLNFAPIAPGGVAETREVSPGVFLDFDAEGRLLGMEVLNASKRLPEKAMPADA